MLYWGSSRVVLIKSMAAVSHALVSISWCSINVMLDLDHISELDLDQISDLAILKSIAVPIIGAWRECPGALPSPAFLAHQRIINAECVIIATNLALRVANACSKSLIGAQIAESR